MNIEEKIVTKSREQRAESQEQRVIGDWSLVFGKHELFGALFLVSHLLFLISYSLFIELRLKPFSEFNYSIRQLKLTAKDSAAMCLFSALSFAVEFIQRIKENNEYRISNIEFRSGASNQVSHFLFLFPYSLFNELRLKPFSEFNYSIRQLKLTAKDNSLLGTKSRNQASNILYPVSSITQSLTGCQQQVASSKLLFNRDSTVHNYKQFSFNPTCWRDSGAPCRQFRFAGYFLSIIFLKMRELKQVLTKKVLTALPRSLDGEVGGGRIYL